MIEVGNALRKPKILLMLTGLLPEEFLRLAQRLGQVWQEHTRQQNWRGEERQRAPGAGPHAALQTPQEMLFFILYYFRHYPIQAIMGAHWGLTQGQANRWILRLMPLLKEALDQELVLPERRTANLERVFKQCADDKLLLDATERPVRRPKNPQKQKACYSGRKKRHTLKNALITAERKVEFLSPTAAGSQSDKRLAEPLEEVKFPSRGVVVSDLGFKGLELNTGALVQPAKKPKGRPLDPLFKRYNRVVAAVRVGVEHVISGVKRCRIVSDALRHIKEGVDDLVMEIAAGLHNFREEFRSPARPVLQPIQLN